MMLVGVIAKQEGPCWSADCDAIGAHTQGRSRLRKLGELLAAVAPDLALTVGPRATGRQKRTQRRSSRRRSVG
jgi:hypothetical protein